MGAIVYFARSLVLSIEQDHRFVKKRVMPERNIVSRST